MASVIFHAYKQVQENGFVKLFRSLKEGFKDGEQLRDFIYVKDVIKVCLWFMDPFTSDEPTVESGIYNLGTGKARSFNALVNATFAGLDKEPSITYFDMPEDLRETYQYYTQANMAKLKNAGYLAPFYTLEDGVDDYVRNYLAKNIYY
jgi:ADP-L-glycero-D-manno-heptose 6-epimerase